MDISKECIGKHYIETGIDGVGHGWVGVLPSLDSERLSRLRQLPLLAATEILSVGPVTDQGIPYSELVVFCKLRSADSRKITLKYAYAAARIIRRSGATVAVDRKVKDFSIIEGLFEDPFYADTFKQGVSDLARTSKESVPRQTLSNTKELTGKTNIEPDDPRLYKQTRSRGRIIKSPKLLTVGEVAGFLGVSNHTVHRRIIEGAIDHIILPSKASTPIYRVPALFVATTLGGNTEALEEFYKFLEDGLA